VAAQPLAYLYLSQIPYTGIDLGPVGMALYWIFFAAIIFTLSYFVLFKGLPFVQRQTQTFASCVAASLNSVPRVTVAVTEPVVPLPAAPAVKDQPRSSNYSAYNGFSSFAANGALSVEDIVKSLSRQHAVEREQEQTDLVPKTEKENEVITSAIPVSAQEFASALLIGDRQAVFAALRQHAQNNGAPEKLVSGAAFLIDDAYRSRIEGTGETVLSRIAARLSTPVLEQLVTALTTAVDASYSSGMTGAKLALARALAVLGA
jgi:hypothetical protein